MGNTKNKEFFDTIIEMDETYVGGKPRKGNDRKKSDDEDDNNPPAPPVNKRGRGTKKTPVAGAVDRNNKQMYARVMLPNKDGKSLIGKQLLDVLEQVCKSEYVIMTDEFKGYNILKRTRHVHL